MGEGFVGVEEAVAPGVEVTLHHSDEGVLGEHLDHGTIPGQFTAVEVCRQEVRHPDLLGDLIHRLKAVGVGFIRAKQLVAVGVLTNQITDDFTEGVGVLLFCGAGHVHRHRILFDRGEQQVFA